MFQLTIGVIAGVFLFKLMLVVLNYRNRKEPIPENVADVYKPEEYGKWLGYTMETHRLSAVSEALDAFVLLVFFFSGTFPALAMLAASLHGDPIIHTLLFLGAYYFIKYCLHLAIKAYRTFGIEERYGFNKTTVGTFVLDQCKIIMMALVIGGGMLYGMLSLYGHMGSGFLLYAWGMIAAFMIAVNILYANVFIRFFNRITPLPEGELRKRIGILTQAIGYEVKNISIMDASKRSGRLNGFFSGFGRFKHIILFDTLVEKCTPEEVVSVLAHEISHYKHRDSLKNLSFSILLTGFYLGMLTVFLGSANLSESFGFSSAHIGFAIILFEILVEPLDILMNVPLSWLSRKAEFRADDFSRKAGCKDAMISALKVLARENYANLTPHPLVVKMTYSHPTVSQRISALQGKL